MNDFNTTEINTFPQEAGIGSWGGLQPVYVQSKGKSLVKSGSKTYIIAGSFTDYRNIHSTLVRMVELFGYDPVKVLYFDVLGFKSRLCPNPDCETLRVCTPMVDCGKYHPWVSHRHSLRCLARIMERVKFLEEHTPADYCITLDLTLPSDISASILDGETRKRVLKRVRHAANYFLQKLGWRMFYKESKLGGFYALHVWASKQPTSPHIHIHLQLFNVAYNSKTKTFHRFRPYISEDVVKFAWRDVLARFGLWQTGDVGLPDCRVGYIKLSNRARLTHRIRYVCRRPLADINEHGDNCNLNTDSGWLRYLLDYTPRLTYVGWCLNLRKFGFSLNKDSGKSFSEYCPECGTELIEEGFLPKIPPDVPWYIITRDGNLQEIERKGLDYPIINVSIEALTPIPPRSRERKPFSFSPNASAEPCEASCSRMCRTCDPSCPLYAADAPGPSSPR